jgi:S1-C subfamily serine protease
MVTTSAPVYDRPATSREPFRPRSPGVVWHDDVVGILDLLIVAWAVLAALSGYRRGASLQLTEYAGFAAGLVAGAMVAPAVASLATSPEWRAVVAVVTLFGLAGVGGGIGLLVGRRIWAAARRGGLGRVDAAAGSVLSVAVVLLAVWFLAYNLVSGPVPAVSRAIRSSAIVRSLEDTLPRPPPLLSQTRGLLDRFGFPQVFADLPPLPAGPVRVAAGQAVRAITDQAAGSTVRIEGHACDAIEEGSGFVVAAGYVVTNAHVVAGVRSPVVQSAGRADLAATPVLFDPGLDVAVLRVQGSLGPALPLSDQAQSRGAKGAVLGYPGGGPLVAGGAAVRREISAFGRDIYGRSTVRRDVYELQAVVRPGNSGGPFVLPSGDVAGMVFAASTTDGNVGYALTSGAVRADVERAIGRTAPVSTQGCVG